MTGAMPVFFLCYNSRIINNIYMFELPQLKYSYDAFESFIDAKTMEIHYTKHHQGYTDKLNKALEGVDIENASIEEVLSELDMKNMELRNNAGGYYNHKLFWEIMSPNGGDEPIGELAEKISESFGSFEEFKDIFSKKASSHFGSGWVWLCKKEDGYLEVVTTSNQDNPLMKGIEGGKPILGLDLWEHAYYLRYQNKRLDYIQAFWNIVDWSIVEEKYKN
jgi:Fe-Mn family superoxide dismutase